MYKEDGIERLCRLDISKTLARIFQRKEIYIPVYGLKRNMCFAITRTILGCGFVMNLLAKNMPREDTIKGQGNAKISEHGKPVGVK